MVTIIMVGCPESKFILTQIDLMCIVLAFPANLLHVYGYNQYMPIKAYVHFLFGIITYVLKVFSAQLLLCYCLMDSLTAGTYLKQWLYNICIDKGDIGLFLFAIPITIIMPPSVRACVCVCVHVRASVCVLLIHPYHNLLV